ncbi:MAG TPA: PAS domain S-box protein [Gammaproteobacteria bacterium]|nr:PAS domain S-box protein [Gammaproteobacteria bacterium]
MMIYSGSILYPIKEHLSSDSQLMMTINSANKQTSSEVFNRFSIFFAPLVIFFISFVAVEYYADFKISRGKLISEESQQIKTARNAITNEMQGVLSDLIFLSRLNEIWNLLDDVSDERAWHLLAQEFLYFSEKKNAYEKIAILSDSGVELIRINFGDGAPYIVEKNHLQQHKTQKYFTESFKLDIGGVYMSSVMKTQTGEPVIQFATPLYASKGKRGVLVFEYRASVLIHALYRSTIEISTHMSMVNENGVWLGSPFQDENRNFFSNSENSFAISFPKAWEKIREKNRGNFIVDSGMYTFDTVYPKTSILDFYIEQGKSEIANVGREKGWKLVSRISPEKLNNQFKQFYERHWIPYLTALLLIAIVAFFLAQNSIRRRLMKEQANYERRLFYTLSHIDLPVVRLDTTGKVLYCNRCLLDILDLAEEEVIGLSWFDRFVDVSVREKEQELFRRIMSRNSPPVSTDTCIRTDRNELHYILWNNTLSTDLQGKAIALTSIGNDITEQKRLEKEVDERNKEITKTQTLAVLGKMASMMAHDLRNPLSSIKMTLQILSKNSPATYPEGISELSELSLEQVRYMEAILAELLLYSRPDEMQCDWLCINDVLDRAINTLQRMILDDHAEIIKDYQKNIPRIYADANKLCQVFSNLISNALQAAVDIEKKPVVTLKTKVVVVDSVPKIQIEVEDNGPGVDSEMSEKLFDPFYTTRAKGTGLGLPIVKRIVDQHQGTVRLIRRESGQGTCSTVVLPTNPAIQDV